MNIAWDKILDLPFQTRKYRENYHVVSVQNNLREMQIRRLNFLEMCLQIACFSISTRFTAHKIIIKKNPK